MFTTLGRLIVRRRRTILVASLVGLVVAIVLGVGVFARLATGGFTDPHAESTRAIERLEDEFDTGPADVVAIVTAESGDVDDPDVAAVGSELTRRFAAIEGFDNVVSYWSLGSAPPLRSDDGQRALILMRLPADTADADNVELVHDVISDLDDRDQSRVAVDVAGRDAVSAGIGETIEGDLARAEAIAVPITLLLLLVVFGSVVAAGLPLLVGTVAVFGAFFVLWVITLFTEVSVFSINLITALGLGLAIDYSLFIVSRFREERGNGSTVDDAVVRTVETAGRTIAFSAITVAISLSALLIFPLYFLRSFAYGGIGVLIVAMIVSVVALPALLAVLGPRVDALRIGKRATTSRASSGGGLWHRIATTVMRRPAPIAVAGIVILVGVGIPFLNVQWGTPDDRVLPETHEVRVASDILRGDFASAETRAFPIVATGNVDATTTADYATALSMIDGVARVDASTGRYVAGDNVAPDDPDLARYAPDASASGATTWFNIVPSVEPISPDAETMIADIRSADTPFDDTLVGGSSAAFVDGNDAIFERVPIAIALIAAATFVLLFLMFGSILVPLKAIVLNTLSLTAVFGFMVWVFQEGNGADLLGFTPTGLTDTAMPILMFCVAFGLSMDYEVFLLSRIKEEYDRSGDNDHAVAAGLEKTGRLVTAAALLLSITFFAFATSDVTFIKMFGLGLAIAVLVDAFIVRSTLVPALMKLAGERNWWAPPPLRRLHDRIGISEASPTPNTSNSEVGRTTGNHP